MAPQPSNPTTSSSSGTYGRHRQSTVPASTTSKQRQLSHLNSQLAQLHAHLSDLDNLVKTTAVQAEYIRSLGGIHGALLMAAAKVLGEGAGSDPNTSESGDNRSSNP